MTTVRPCRRTSDVTAEDSAVQAGRAVVDKTFTLLEAWSHRFEILGVSELARRTGLPKSTTNRLLRTLDTAALIERAGSGYRIAERFHGFAELLLPGYRPGLREVALPFLQDLYEASHETVHLGVLDGVDVRCVEKLFGHRRSPFASKVGDALPVHSTALGKVLLAYAPEATRRHVLGAVLVGRVAAATTRPPRFHAELNATRRNGFAFDRQETHPAVNCVAAPVVGRTGEAVAAISVSGPSDRFDPVTVIDVLQRKAKAVSIALAGPQQGRGVEGSAA